MKLTINEKIEEIFLSDKEVASYNIKCFQFKPSNGLYNFYIFTCEFDSEEDLIKKYSSINDIIAFDFQRTLINDVEKWNLYLFCFLNKKISSEVKSIVEQNKYATRKIVFDNLKSQLTLDQKKKLILNKLFILDLNIRNGISIKETNGISEIIEHSDPLLFRTILDSKKIKGRNAKDLKEKKSKLIKKYLEMKKSD